jgi:hypothetical protein
MKDGDLDGDGKENLAFGIFHFVAPRVRFLIPVDYLADYFVMWDDKILHHLIHSDDKFTSKARRELVNLELPAGAKSVDKNTKFPKIPDSKWLSKAQDKML